MWHFHYPPMSDEQANRHLKNESVIILAAGSSTRLGQAKQLVGVKGMPLLLKSVLVALEAHFEHIVVVLGYHADEHKKTIDHLPMEAIIHDEWEKGMGSSLKKGLLHTIESRPETSAVVVMVCDQPLLTATHLLHLRELYKNTSKPIIASRYGTILGVPALFDRSLFPEILNINDAEGAKAVIVQNAESVESIHWEEGNLDIDTPEDLEILNSL